MKLEDIKYNYNNNFISIEKHPYVDLYILNYTKKASQQAIWNEVTLNSRGLIIDKIGNIVSYPFRKFFEIDQLPAELIPSDNPTEIVEKLDGTLGIMYWFNGRPYISTRGSFTSFQALKATEILHTKYSHIFHLLNQNHTYLFEIISPDNRIVVDYGDKEDIFLIGVIDNETREDIDINNYKEIFNLPLKFDVKSEFSIDDLYSIATENSIEGFVIKYENNFRIKLKNKDYVSKFKFYTYSIKKYALEKVFFGAEDENFEIALSVSDLKLLERLMNNIICLKEKEFIGNSDELFKIVSNKVIKNQFFFDIGNFKEFFIY